MELPDSKREAKEPDPGEFQNHPRWHRLIIAIAGPAANVILAVILMTTVFSVDHTIPYGLYKPAVVGWVMPGAAAEKAGIQTGDRIVQLADKQDPTWQDVQNAIMISPGLPLALEVSRAGKTVPMTLVPDTEPTRQAGYAGWQREQPFTVTTVERGMPGEKAGLRSGDEILSVDGEPIHTTGAMQVYVQESKERPLKLLVLRDGKRMQLTVIPELRKEAGSAPVYRIGFYSQPTEVERLAVSAAFQRSLDECRKLSGLVLDLLGRMVQNKVSVKQMSGPIEIVRFSGEVMGHGSANDVLEFMALISLQLGLFNLLPIPILDGGLIAMLLVESAIRRDISEGIKVRLYQLAFVGLVLFAGMVIFNDVVRLLPAH